LQNRLFCLRNCKERKKKVLIPDVLTGKSVFFKVKAVAGRIKWLSDNELLVSDLLFVPPKVVGSG